MSEDNFTNLIMQSSCLDNSDRTVYADDLYPFWLAVLQQAIEDLSRSANCEDATNWFISNEMYIGSFQWVCLTLNINIAYFRNYYYDIIYKQFLDS